MDSIRDLYNKAYLYVNTKLDKTIAQNEKDIDKKITDFFLDRGVRRANIPVSFHREIKVEVIRSYRKEAKTNSSSHIFDQAIDKSTLKIEKKIMLSKLPEKPIQIKSMKTLQSKKKDFIEEPKTLDPEIFKKVEKHLKNRDVQDLAKKIDQDFETYELLSTNGFIKEMTLKDFGNLVLSKYTPSTMDIFKKIGKSPEDIGSDDRVHLYTAILLLQKNDGFVKNIIAMNDFMNTTDRVTRSFLNPLQSQLYPMTVAVENIFSRNTTIQ